MSITVQCVANLQNSLARDVTPSTTVTGSTRGWTTAITRKTAPTIESTKTQIWGSKCQTTAFTTFCIDQIVELFYEGKSY